MLSGRAYGPLRDCLARAFLRSAMKQAAIRFTLDPASPRLSPGFDGQPVQSPLIDLAAAFVQLREARHDADYNCARRSARREVLDLVDLTDQAFPDRRDVGGCLRAETFPTGLLAYRNMQGRRPDRTEPRLTPGRGRFERNGTSTRLGAAMPADMRREG